MNPSSPHRALLIDDHELVARGLALLLQQELGLEACLCTRYEQALAEVEGQRALPARPGFALALCDLEMPGMSGLEGVQRLHAAAPGLPIVVVSSHGAELARHQVLRQGARAFVGKGEPPQVLLATVRRVLAGLPEPIGADTPSQASGAGLTARQQQVLLLMDAGKSNKLIARALDMSENTVRNHVAAILDRLGVANRHEAAAAARRLGLLA